jgi:CheY-like chemotaxis protein
MRRPPRPLSSRRPRRAHITADQLAALTHELRTPLNGVLGLARLLEGTELDAEQRAYSTGLRECGEHLLTLVNGLLDFARLGAGAIELNLTSVDVDDTLRSVCELLAPQAAEKGLEVGWATAAGVGRIRADEARLKQILLNFADNAVKFAETGGLLAGVAERPDGRLRFTVEDTGPGVPLTARNRIFEAFAQADAAHADLGGAGLGLAIARRLAHAMGGEVGVEASPLGGALFWFEAPFAKLAAAEPPVAFPGQVVGVASSNPILHEATLRQVRACGGRGVGACDLASLVARTGPGDVLLVDHALTRDGELMVPPADRPAIVLLAGSERDRLQQYRSAGYAGSLVKPLRRADLVEQVLLATGAAAEAAGLNDEESLGAHAAPGARVLLVEDDPVNALLARTLLAREGCEVDHARSGEEALAAVKVGVYDIILMDLRMRGLSGQQTARMLRAHGVKAPIVALTADVFEDDRLACVAAGMDDFLIKPLSPAALRAVLSRWALGGWTQKAARAKVG